MADRITANDILDPQVKKEFLELLKIVDTMVSKFKDIQTVAKTTDAELKKGVKTNQELGKAKKTVAENSQMLSDIEKEAEKLRQKHYQLIVKATAAETKSGKEYARTAEEIKRKNQVQREAAKVADAESNSIARLTARNKQLIQERNKVNTATEVGRKRIKEINAEIDKNNATIRSNTSALEQQKNNVGNYRSALKGLGTQLLAVTGVTVGLRGAMQLFNNVMMSAQSTGDALTHTKAALRGTFNGLFRTIAQGDFTFKTLIQNMRNGANAAREYSIALDEIGDIMRAVDLRAEESMDRLDELRVIMSETETKTLAERKAALKEYEQINNEILESRINANNEIIEAERERLKNDYNINDEQVALIENFIRNYDKLTESQLKNVQKVIDAREKEKKTIEIIEASLVDISSGRLSEMSQRQKDEIRILGERYEQEKALLSESELAYFELSNVIDGLADVQRNQIADALKGIATANRQFSAAQRVAVRRQQELEREERRIATDRLKRQKEIDKALADAQKGLYDSYVRVVDDAYNQITEIEQAATDTSLDIFAAESAGFEQDLAERLQAYERFMAQIRQMETDLKDYKVAIFNQTAELYATGIERQLQQAEEQKNYEIQLAGESTLARKMAEEKYADEVRKLKRRQAIADKLAGLFNIGISTAEGVVNYMKSPLTAPLVPLVITLGALQAATVLAQPIPKFYKGVRNFEGGMAIVGEQGEEIYRTPDNQIGITPDVATLMTLPKGTDVFTHTESKKMVQNSTIDIEQLVKEQRKTRQAIANKAEYHTHIDSNGFRHMLKRGQSTTVFIDKYIRS